jgi:soluble lytic murein transglycosylase-like protein
MLALLLSITGFASSAPASSSGSWSARYDSLFKAAVAGFWPDLADWTWLKAQGIQESGLEAAAVSPVGAVGLMQMMPGTWGDEQRALGWRNIDPRSAPHSIIAGAHYMRQLRDVWSGRGRSALERQRLALPSYNAGTGNILKAQALCHDARDWAAIAPCLAAVTGAANAKQTTDYGRLIARWRNDLRPGCIWTQHRGGCGRAF